jgi:hypothetical protein
MANTQAIDQLYVLRAAFPKFRPDDDPTIVYTNLRILLAFDEPAPAGELYAKGTPRSDVDANISSGGTRLRFTWVSEEVKQFFANQHERELL